ncbi:MAG: hypothetical protein KDC87_03420 [Planctomycetes bacterium]|nr:hypothetical protein [Planctomycetota bacterium]MCB9871288.1 hypothetical protein [Planctomycetota bacterium]
MATAPSLRKRDSEPRPRPRFDLLAPIAPERVFTCLHEAIRENPAVRGVALDRERFEIIRDDKSFRIWAPQLDVKLVEVDGGTKVMGRFGPHPHVWMAYMSLYMGAGFLAIGCAAYGVVQWLLDEHPWSLYLTPLAALFAALVYGASYVGQGLATAQMFELRQFLEDSVATAVAGKSSPVETAVGE